MLVWKYKDASEWTSIELQQWLRSLELAKQREQIIITAVQESECTGEDFMNCADGQEIADSFGIKKRFGDYLFNALRLN